MARVYQMPDRSADSDPLVTLPMLFIEQRKRTREVRERAVDDGDVIERIRAQVIVAEEEYRLQAIATALRSMLDTVIGSDIRH